MTKDKFGFKDNLTARLIGNNHFSGRLALRGLFETSIFRDGKLLDRFEHENFVVNVGIDEMLETYFNGSTYTADFDVGLIDDTGGPAPGITDTMGSHGSWLELTNYDEGAPRPVLAMAAASGKVIATSAATVFTISSTDAFGGAFVVSGGGDKGSSTGVLFSASAFGSVRDLVDNDVLNITYSLTGADT